jgi:hypothetical protein
MVTSSAPSIPTSSQIDLAVRKVLPSFWESTKTFAVLLFDFFALLRFGPKSPRKYELLYIDPYEVKMGYHRVSRPPHLGVVRNKYWNLKLVDVEDARGGTVKTSKNRTVSGETWESCVEREKLPSSRRQPGKFSHPQAEDFQEPRRARYRALDALTQELKETGRLRPQKEFRPQSYFREKEGIGICINAEGKLLLAHGHHRFGIVLGLGITPVPVYLHSVHPDFMKRKDWKQRLQLLRTDPNDGARRPRLKDNLFIISPQRKSRA